MPINSPETALQTLQNTFNYDAFRDRQAEIIQSVLRGEDTLVLMPTGGGKSLCYQIPALNFMGTAIVVSPLIALMKDQVDALAAKGVEAAFLNSSLKMSEQREVEKRLQEGHLKLLYVSPERLMTTKFLHLLKKSDISLFAIDEAHCVSQWGHDFRPEYMQLGILGEEFPSVPKIALTATAGEATRKDMVESLGFEKANVFISSFDRPNIRYSIKKKTKKEQNLKDLLEFITTSYHKDSGIVYCLSRKKTEETAKFLKQNGIDARAYHAGMTSSQRDKVQDRFLSKKAVVIVATNAFGMGIDKSDVRFVAHMDLPKCPESYYQETGRAGRDGLPAQAWMLYGMQEVVMLKRMMGKGVGVRRKRVNEEKLEAMLGICETPLCRREVLLNYFNDPYSGPCDNCDTCLSQVEKKINVTQEAALALKFLHETKCKVNIWQMAQLLVEEKIKEGTGPDLWRAIFRQLVASGAVKAKMDGSSSLELTRKALLVAQGKREVWIRSDYRKTAKKAVVKKTDKRKTAPKSPRPSTIFSENENPAQNLFESLKEFRRQLAKAKRTKPYKIFPDKTLMELAQKRPTTLSEMESVYGVGPKKIKRFGRLFIEAMENLTN